MEFTHEQIQCIEAGVTFCYAFFFFGILGGFIGSGIWKFARMLVEVWECLKSRKKQ